MFKEIPASKKSISKRKPVYGVGVNDAKYSVYSQINGNQSMCPFYKKWMLMLQRCYSENLHNEKPGYKECEVHSEWLIFSNFRSWMICQEWENKHLDKDIINPGNKLYSKDNCRFITGKLNTLLNDRAAKRGNYPQGVSLDKRTNKYIAHVSINGKVKHLGVYDTPDQASDSYVKEKVKLILKAADEQDDPLIANGLRLHAKLL